MKKVFLLLLTAVITTLTVSAQNRESGGATSYLNMRWSRVATGMNPEWYGSSDAKLVAENVLISQKQSGGWAKNMPYHRPFSDSLKNYYLSTKNEIGGTFDNGATITEMRFLAKVFSQVKDQRYREAFTRGLRYILAAQYDNGGWPQFYPVKDAPKEVAADKTVPYSMHITYNDNAMVNILQFLKEIYEGKQAFGPLQIDNSTQQKIKSAFDKGIECILNTQIRQDGKLTVWCAQHDEVTLAPANARAYELASFSGSESAGIALLLMDIGQPDEKIIDAVEGAVKWFEDYAITGLKVERGLNSSGKRDTYVVKEINAPKIWARFYDLDTRKPYFCDRDGIKKNTLAEIGDERRNGYSWYSNGPQQVLDKYPEWRKGIKAL